MVDVALIKVSAGDGGNGAVSFRRLKFVPKGGPDGGDGGNGGSIYLVGDTNLRTLDYFAGRQKFAARPGGRGGKNRSTGASADDVEVLVPQGTIVYQIDVKDDAVPSKKQLYDLLRANKDNYDVEGSEAGPVALSSPVRRPRAGLNSTAAGARRGSPSTRHPLDLGRLTKLGEVIEDGQKLLVAAGGKGGRGNDAFKGPTNTTPREAEAGRPGEARWLVLELKLLADVGLIGLPNAGKSTLLSVLTAARPKIADYEFTTLAPNLGVWRRSTKYQPSLRLRPAGEALNSKQTSKSKYRNEELIIADIPGLIEGASQGKGLGDEFLRHVERTKTLVHVIAINPNFQTLNSKQSPNSISQISNKLFRDYQTVRKELWEYHPSLLAKPEVVLVNKIDLLGKDQMLNAKLQITNFFKGKGVNELVFVSAVTREGVEELIGKLVVE